MKKTGIDLRVWHQFVTVAEELHFSRAALRLNMTQPPLTQAIAQLERMLGVLLFERTRRRVTLTAAGAALLPEALELLAHARALPARARAAAAGESGRVRLAFVSTIGFDTLPTWVRQFRLLAPDVALELTEATGDVQIDALRRREVDAGLILHSPSSAPTGFDRLSVMRESIVLALPARHQLARVRMLGLREVLAEPMVLFPRRILPSVHDAIVALYQAEGMAPAVAQEAIQMQTIVNLVSGGLGLAWVPESVMRFRRSGVVYRRPEAFKAVGGRRLALPEGETSLVWSSRVVHPALARFIQFVQASSLPSVGIGRADKGADVA